MNRNGHRTLVVGLGNPILGDDGVGWRVAEKVKRELEIRGLSLNSPILHSSIDVDCLALGGLSLMERLIGYERVIVVDAVTSGQSPGTVVCLRLDELPDFDSAHSRAAHDTSLQHALRLGRQMGARLPSQVMVVGVEIVPQYDFSEVLSPDVHAAVPRAAQAVLNLLQAIEAEA